MTKLPPSPFQLVAGHPALDLINTLDNRYDPSRLEELLPTYDELLRFTLQSQLITDRQARKLQRLHASPDTTPSQRSEALRQVIALREHLASVTYALLDHSETANIQPATSLSALESTFKSAASVRLLAPSPPGTPSSFEWKLKGVGRDLNSPLWLLALSANDLLTSPAISRLRACASPACRWLFLDTSKNHTRRWCDMRVCGNRNKARQFQARQGSLA